jgi:monofunctional biosynthetic peptidoglycan transglycosylase
LALLLFLGALLGYELLVLGHALWWAGHNPTLTAFMDERTREARAARPAATVQRQWVAYSHISIHLKRAVVASEDSGFLRHSGFDWEGIHTALEKNMRRGRIVAGGSTITQQLAKNLFLSAQRSIWRKAQEALATIMLEAALSKRRILEIYLNVVEWGDLLFGAQAAAGRYFRTNAADLTPWQAARLAVMLPNPRYYERHLDSPYLAERTRTILNEMAQAHVP